MWNLTVCMILLSCGCKKVDQKESLNSVKKIGGVEFIPDTCVIDKYHCLKLEDYPSYFIPLYVTEDYGKTFSEFSKKYGEAMERDTLQYVNGVREKRDYAGLFPGLKYPLDNMFERTPKAVVYAALWQVKKGEVEWDLTVYGLKSDEDIQSIYGFFLENDN